MFSTKILCKQLPVYTPNTFTYVYSNTHIYPIYPILDSKRHVYPIYLNSNSHKCVYPVYHISNSNSGNDNFYLHTSKWIEVQNDEYK